MSQRIQKPITLYRHFVAPGALRGQVAGFPLARDGNTFAIAATALHGIVPTAGDELHDDTGKKWRVDGVSHDTGTNTYKLTCQELS